MAPPDPLADVKRLLARDPAAAARLAEAAHRRSPTPEATLLLAAARRRTGDAAGALALLAPLATAMPRAWGVQFEYGMTLAVSGDGAGGLAALERTLALNPDATLARHALGDLRVIAGQERGAASPAMGDTVLAKTIASFLAGDAAAQEALGVRFGLSVHDAAAACLVAGIGAEWGLHDAVAKLLRDLALVAPGYAPAQFRRAEALHCAERDEDALVPIEALREAQPGLLPALALRGAILLRLGREEDAVADLRAVADASPADPRAWLVYGHALRALGDRAAALAAYRRAITAEPAFGEAYWSIADLKTGSIAADEMAAMRALLASDTLSVADRSHIDFALARACEDGGNYADAFAHYRRANAGRRALQPYDAAAQEAYVARSMALLDADFLAARRDWGAPSNAPVFVLGMPRSGSSLVEQILASHSAVEGVSELPFVTAIARGIPHYPDGLADLSREQLADLGDAYLARVATRRRTDRPFFVDKFPGNALHIGLIALMLPNAKIIDARRDPRDCCVSLYTQSFAAGQDYSYDLADLGRYYRHYTQVMAHFDRVLPGQILRVDYEALIDDPEGNSRRLLDFCGLPFEPQCLRFFENTRAVRTASSEQVRQPLYRGSIGRWRRFEPWLGPLLDALELQSIDVAVASR